MKTIELDDETMAALERVRPIARSFFSGSLSGELPRVFDADNDADLVVYVILFGCEQIHATVKRADGIAKLISKLMPPCTDPNCTECGTKGMVH